MLDWELRDKTSNWEREDMFKTLETKVVNFGVKFEDTLLPLHGVILA